MLRVIAVILLTIAVLFLWIGVDGLLNANTKGRFVAAVGNAFGERIDAVDWARHWFATSVEMSVVGVLIAIAACGLWQRRTGALLLFAATLFAQLTWQLAQYLVGYSKYAFEMPELLAIALYAVVIAGSTVVFMRLHRKLPVEIRT